MKVLITSLMVLLSNQVLAASATNCDDVSQFTDVSMSEMKDVVKNSSATIIDVNSDASYKKGHIPKAVHYSSHKDNLKSVLPKSKSSMIIAYCGGKMCTAWERAAKAACKLGYSNIKHFSEGITGWEENS